MLVEYFDAAAVERGEPALRAEPLGVVNLHNLEARLGRKGPGPSTACRAHIVDRASARRDGAPAAKIGMIVEANAEARAQGVRPGMTEAEARARCPGEPV